MMRNDIDSIIQGAEKGDPRMILEMAKLYKAGVFGESNHEEYMDLRTVVKNKITEQEYRKAGRRKSRRFIRQAFPAGDGPGSSVRMSFSGICR